MAAYTSFAANAKTLPAYRAGSRLPGKRCKSRLAWRQTCGGIRVLLLCPDDKLRQVGADHRSGHKTVAIAAGLHGKYGGHSGGLQEVISGRYLSGK